MSTAPPDPFAVLASGHLLMMLDHQTALLGLDWSNPDAVAREEKRGRMIGTHRTNIEKIGPVLNDAPLVEPAEAQSAREELRRRLLQLEDRIRRTSGRHREGVQDGGGVPGGDEPLAALGASPSE